MLFSCLACELARADGFGAGGGASHLTRRRAPRSRRLPLPQRRAEPAARSAVSRWTHKLF